MKKLSLLLLPALLVVTTSFHYATADDVVNYLHTDNILKFDNREYKLAWSTHPVSNYYKQEYIPKDENIDHYTHMLTIDFLGIDTPAVNIARIKVGEIIERKKTDAVANYQMRANAAKTDFLLDFIMSDGDGNTVSTVEFNAYRYKNYKDKTGHKGVLLFAYSERAYGDDITPFLQKLGDKRMSVLKTVIKYEIPEVEIK